MGTHTEPNVPYIAAVTTYFGYLVLFVFGYLRDLVRARVPEKWLLKKVGKNKEGFAPLLSDYEDFYTRRLYDRIQDCWNRPICSAPGAFIDLMLRERNPTSSTFKLTGKTRQCLNLGSYNYLGFANTESDVTERALAALEAHGVGTTSPRAELGTNASHLELESKIANFLGKPAAMVFGMGFATNSTILPALIGKGGLIISDGLNHASIVTGARASGAKIKVFKHNDPQDLAKLLRHSIAEGQPRTHRPWTKILICVEGIYSMEGEICRLPEIVAVAKQYKAYLYLDEAHSIGAMGGTGRGVCEHLGVPTDDVDILMGTFTKSFGSMGGYIASSKAVIAHLRKVSPGWNHACPMAPPCCGQSSAVLEILDGKDGTDRGHNRITRLRRNSKLFRRGLEAMGCEVIGDPDAPVIPVMLYNPSKMPAFSRECLKRNLAVVVVGFPATALITSRVRFCVSAAHTEEDVYEALKAIDDVAYRVMIKYRGNLHLPSREALMA